MANKLLLNLEDYVRVINTTGDVIYGRYDGINYEFPDGSKTGEYVDVHKQVAMHVFGFMLPESAEPPMQDKTAALLRLGWLRGDSRTLKTPLAPLRKLHFHPIPPLPTP